MTCIYFQTRIPLHRLFSNYLITIDECMARVMPVLSNIFTYIYIQSRIPIAAIIYRAQATYCEHHVICHVPLSPCTCPSLVFNFVLSLSFSVSLFHLFTLSLLTDIIYVFNSIKMKFRYVTNANRRVWPHGLVIIQNNAQTECCKLGTN